MLLTLFCYCQQFREKPYAACLLTDKFGSHCHHCFARWIYRLLISFNWRPISAQLIGLGAALCSLAVNLPILSLICWTDVELDSFPCSFNFLLSWLPRSLLLLMVQYLLRFRTMLTIDWLALCRESLWFMTGNGAGLMGLIQQSRNLRSDIWISVEVDLFWGK